MRDCSFCSMGRRDFIRIAFGAAAGTALGAKFGLAAGQEAASPKAKSVILLWMQGAASQIDSWDPKPGTHGRPSRRSTQTRLVRQRAPAPNGGDRGPWSLVRTLFSRPEPRHRAVPAPHRRASGRPATRTSAADLLELGMRDSGLPGVRHHRRRRRRRLRLPGPGTARSSSEFDDPLEDQVVPGLAARRRARLLRAQNGDSGGRATAPRARHQRAYDRALALMMRHLKAFDITGESDEEEALRSGAFSRACLMARRLVEAGTRFVEVRLADWDSHSDPTAKGADVELTPGSGLLEDLGASRCWATRSSSGSRVRPDAQGERGAGSRPSPARGRQSSPAAGSKEAASWGRRPLTAWKWRTDRSPSKTCTRRSSRGSASIRRRSCRRPRAGP